MKEPKRKIIFGNEDDYKKLLKYERDKWFRYGREETKKEIIKLLEELTMKWGDDYDEGKEPEIFKDMDKLIKKIRKL